MKVMNQACRDRESQPDSLVSGGEVDLEVVLHDYPTQVRGSTMGFKVLILYLSWALQSL